MSDLRGTDDQKSCSAAQRWQQALAVHPLLVALSPAEAAQWGGACHFLEPEAERYVIRVDAPAQRVMLLLEGAVRVCVRRSSNKEALLKMLQAPALFGEMESFLKLPFAASVSTLVASRLCSVPTPLFVQTLRSNAEMGFRLSVDVSQRLRVATANETGLAFNRLGPRLMRLLMDYTAVLASSSNPDNWLTINHDRLADDMAVTRKAIVSEFAHFRREGVVESRGQSYRITSTASAEAVARDAQSLVHSMAFHFDEGAVRGQGSQQNRC